MVAVAANIESLHRMTREERDLRGLTVSGSDHLTAYNVYAEAVNKHGYAGEVDRKSTRLNSSHLVISYAVFCLKKKMTSRDQERRHQAHQLAGTNRQRHAQGEHARVDVGLPQPLQARRTQRLQQLHAAVCHRDR